MILPFIAVAVAVATIYQSFYNLTSIANAAAIAVASSSCHLLLLLLKLLLSAAIAITAALLLSLLLKIAANHALSDCHAMCADAKTALAIAVVPYAIEEKMEESLYQVCFSC